MEIKGLKGKAAELAKKLDPEKLPVHVAVIMDGNGRWAKKRGLPRVKGHERGAKTLRRTVETAARLGIKYLTAFAFSKENWNRPREEIEFLMNLLRRYLKNEIPTLVKNEIKLQVAGDLEELPVDIREKIREAEEKTGSGTRLTLVLAINYGGRAEILRAARGMAKEGDFSPESFRRHLYLPHVPDPDLLIRTSGEQRISNFLLWQIAYTELYFTPVLWPDFSEEEFIKALVDYQGRERRFGKI